MHTYTQTYKQTYIHTYIPTHIHMYIGLCSFLRVSRASFEQVVLELPVEL